VGQPSLGPRGGASVRGTVGTRFSDSRPQHPGTLIHVFTADRIWLSRVQGESPTNFISDGDYNLHVLQIDWPLLHEKWNEWAGELTDDSAGEQIPYRAMNGDPFVAPVWQIVLHVVNHGAHHRGQVSGFLRTLGHTPPQLDLIRYYREK